MSRAETPEGARRPGPRNLLQWAALRRRGDAEKGIGMGRILLATEDMTALDVLTGEIEGDGLEVMQVLDGQQALESALSEPPDLVLLDVHLPVFDGFETCRMLREDPEVAERLPIVLLLSEDVDAHKLEQIQATATLCKTHEAYEIHDLLVKHLAPEAWPEPPEEPDGAEAS